MVKDYSLESLAQSINNDFSIENCNFISCIKDELTNKFNSDINIKKNKNGIIEAVEYYDYNSNLSKIIRYSSQEITSIEYYNSNYLSYVEYLEKSKITKKVKYNKDKQEQETLQYKYSEDGLLTRIDKLIKDKVISVLYSYDLFKRVIIRQFIFNDFIKYRQSYKYDILDRVIEYEDNDKKIIVEKMTQENQISNFVVINLKNNSKINVYNKYKNHNYLESELTINNNTQTCRNDNYVDNPLLKRPYANEEDFNLILSTFMNKTTVPKPTTERINNNMNNINLIINNKLNSNVLPISMRKLQLYNAKIAVNS